jgi:UDP-N-acetylmuramoyl-L-alanyl-D-glutamate--2,6-diaminopimelate ligase
MSAPVDHRALHRKLRTVCVTGTNGKTTTTTMIEAIVAASGEPSARVTTLGAWVQGEQLSSETSAAAFDAAVTRAVEVGVRTLAVETTSQALADGFSRAWPAEVAVFTNLSRDHLDVHESLEAYLAAKAQLFMSLLPGGSAVLNAADASSALLDEVIAPGITRLAYAARPVDPACAALPLALAAERVEPSLEGTRITLARSPLAEQLGGEIVLSIVGEVHAENALGAALAGLALGYAPAVIRRALESFGGVPGRFERVHDRPAIIVDFAHTPDALERALRLGRGLVEPARGRVICVFGCGGDRDPGKRHEMGAVAGALADRVFITSDNPRSEDPARIAAAVLEGARGGPARVEVVLDRAEAITKAIELAAAPDIVIVAGKGHERTQTVGERVIPFNDAEVATRVAASRRSFEEKRR